MKILFTDVLKDLLYFVQDEGMRNLQQKVKDCMEQSGLLAFENGNLDDLSLRTQIEEVLEMSKNIRLFECKMKSLFRKF